MVGDGVGEGVTAMEESRDGHINKQSNVWIGYASRFMALCNVLLHAKSWKIHDFELQWNAY